MKTVHNVSDGMDRAVIGEPPNHWLYSSSPATFDLTRPPPPDFALPDPQSSVSLSTTTKNITISPSKTALLVIDMQNFFLSPYLGRPIDSAGNIAAQNILETAIPAARDAGIQIIWLNWGLTDEELQQIPPSTRRAFGFEATLENDKSKIGPALDAHGVNGKLLQYILSLNSVAR